MKAALAHLIHSVLAIGLALLFMAALGALAA